jgi:hypothetical protein
MCECVSLRRAAVLLNVRVQLLVELAARGHVDHHRHGERVSITREGLDELRWRIACAQLEAA